MWFFESTIPEIIDYLLFFVCIFILIGSIVISVQTRFVQLRFFPNLLKMFFSAVFGKRKKKVLTLLPQLAQC